MSLKKKMSAFAVMSTLALNAFVVPAFAAINVSDSNITNLTVNTDTELNVSGTTSVTGSVNLKAKTTITPSGDKVDFSKSTLTLAPTENSTFDLGGVKTNKIVIGSDFVTTVNGFVAPTSGVESAPGVTQKPEFTDVSGNPADPVIKPQPDQGVDTKAIDDAISAANSAKQGVAISEDGKDVAPTSKWVTKEVSDALDAAIAKAEAAKGTVKTEDEVAAAASELDAAVQTYNEAKQDGTKADPELDTKAIDDAISAANSAKQGVAISEDGKDVAPTSKWVTKEVSDALDAAIAKAEAAKGTVKTEDEVAAAASELDAAVQTYNEAKQDGTKADPELDTKAIDDAISAANSAKQGVAISEDGKDVAPTSKWVTKEVSDALDAAIAKAEAAKGTVKTEDEVAAAASELDAAVQTYNEAKQDGTNASTVPEVRVEAHTVADTEGTAVTGTYNDGTFTIGHDFTKLTLEKGGAPEEAKWVGVYIEGPEGATKAAKLVIVGTNEKSFDNVEFETETGFEKGFFYFFAAQEDGNSNELTITWADKDGATVGVEKLKVVYVNTSN